MSYEPTEIYLLSLFMNCREPKPCEYISCIPATASGVSNYQVLQRPITILLLDFLAIPTASDYVFFQTIFLADRLSC